MTEEAAPQKRKPGRPRKVVPPAQTGTGFTPSPRITFASRRVIQAMAKRTGALPSAKTLTDAAAQMEQTAIALRWMAENGIPAEMTAAPVEPPEAPPAPVTEPTVAEEADGDDEPATVPEPRRRGRRKKYDAPPTDVVCTSCGIYGHDAEHCPEDA